MAGYPTADAEVAPTCPGGTRRHTLYGARTPAAIRPPQTLSRPGSPYRREPVRFDRFPTKPPRTGSVYRYRRAAVNPDPDTSTDKSSLAQAVGRRSVARLVWLGPQAEVQLARPAVRAGGGSPARPISSGLARLAAELLMRPRCIKQSFGSLQLARQAALAHSGSELAIPSTRIFNPVAKSSFSHQPNPSANEIHSPGRFEADSARSYRIRSGIKREKGQEVAQPAIDPAMAAILLGPPVIRGARPSPPVAAAAAEAPASHPFLDLLDACFNDDAPAAASDDANGGKGPRMARTENNSATYASSGNPCLDLFFQVVPDTPPERVRQLVTVAWAHDPLTALKLVANLRGVRGTGKSDKEGFYAAALWMHERHPKTLACNLPALAEFGYLKDFPELLYRLIHGADVRKLAKAKVGTEKIRRKVAEARAARLAGSKRARGESSAPQPTAALSKSKTKSKRSNKSGAAGMETEEEASEVVEQKSEEMEVDHKEAAAAKKITMTKEVRKVAKLAVQSIETYYGDGGYRFLFDCVAQFFADLLASDLEQLAPGGKKRNIGLAAKWCPTPGSSFDRTTLLCEAIARLLFPRDSNPDYALLSEEHYAYSVLRRLRREVLVPLRKVLELPEVYMSAQRWSELPYTRVASVAMRRYKDLFKKHDEARFDKYLEDVEAGKAKIAADRGRRLPRRGRRRFGAAWRRMVEDLRKKGSLSNCIAVCDVSESMSGTPMEVCVALGLLISELSEKPWAGRVITFSSTPQIHKIEGKTLAQKMSFIKRMDWNMNTNFQAVFDRILHMAVDGRLAKDKMIRTVFVFSDMEFDQASFRPWETDYQAICRKFKDAGYGDAVPQIVFWNLRDSQSIPVTSTQPGVAMVGSFSKNLVKLFLENDGVVSPEAVMAAAISGAEYQKLAVFD
ncbi:hypothetical protein HU200_040027 [Digitaria exilis]|uniref:Uncharacterized protein n=1 Tax=Digitaria exilis TaxID=1010633 RepID=A0A835B9J4_9POAL|nr:hypothetical protein HU200_040027 [Digitaria exilis]